MFGCYKTKRNSSSCNSHHSFTSFCPYKTYTRSLREQKSQTAQRHRRRLSPEALLGETEPRLLRARLDCWGVGERRGLAGGLPGGEGRWRRRGGLAEGDRRRVLRGGLDTGLLGGFFGGERERDEDEEELLPDSEAEERLLLQSRAHIRSWPATAGNISAQRTKNCSCLQAQTPSHRQQHSPNRVDSLQHLVWRRGG